jgi:hypothetical protein
MSRSYNSSPLSTSVACSGTALLLLFYFIHFRCWGCLRTKNLIKVQQVNMVGLKSKIRNGTFIIHTVTKLRGEANSCTATQKLSAFMEAESSLPCSQKPATGPAVIITAIISVWLIV